MMMKKKSNLKMKKPLKPPSMLLPLAPKPDVKSVMTSPLPSEMNVWKPLLELKPLKKLKKKPKKPKKKEEEEKLKEPTEDTELP
eukprot:NODE_2607_length_501_cov_152.880531_g2071_i0.p2 GENE.NODE_2607_length_501_cov_152.880531_g2071_i0~~NODE_2607_length_501_cov_152.880531_g2071_i0.p2  ORF type:complete len:84 (+),score=25.61 NODE_2607_length_501_cov_152.880531_g2071_i0:166-417(+)